MMQSNFVGSLLVIFSISFLLAIPFKNSQAQAVDPELLSALKQSKQDYGFVDEFDAQVWLHYMDNKTQRFIKDKTERHLMLKLVHQEAKAAGLNPELIMALIQTESYFERFAISRVGARGYMQIMPFWLKELDRPDDNLFDPAVNIRFGCTILAHYLKREKGNLRRALGRYNGSLGRNKYPNKVLGFWKDFWYLNDWPEIYY